MAVSFYDAKGRKKSKEDCTANEDAPAMEGREEKKEKEDAERAKDEKQDWRRMYVMKKRMGNWWNGMPQLYKFPVRKAASREIRTRILQKKNADVTFNYFFFPVRGI